MLGKMAGREAEKDEAGGLDGQMARTYTMDTWCAHRFWNCNGQESDAAVHGVMVGALDVIIKLN